MEDMDQVVLVIANKAGDLLTYIGGPEYSHLLVPLIESLCGMEETVVRSAAAASASPVRPDRRCEGVPRQRSILACPCLVASR